MKIKSLTNNLIDLMGVQSQEIEYYRQFPIIQIFIINMLLVAPSSILLEGNEPIIINLMLAFAFTFINAAFLMYWFGRVNIKHSFLTFLHYDIIISIAANIPFLVILVVIKYFDSTPWIGFFGGLGCIFYVIYMVSLNYAQATKSLNSYAFIGVLLFITFQAILEVFLISKLY